MKKDEIDYLKNIGKAGLRHSINKPYSDMNCGAFLAEIGAIMSIMPSPPAKVLDLGCGTGWTSKFFSLRGYDVTGADISFDMIDNAIKHNTPSDNLKFIAADYENLKFDSEFDCVVFFDSLHHADNEHIAIDCAYKSLKMGGIIIASEPGSKHAETSGAKHAMKKYGVTEKSMPPKYIIRLGEKAGFKEFKIYPRANLINFILYARENKSLFNNFLKQVLKFNFVKTLAMLYLITFHKKSDGIVVMKK